MSGGAVAKSKPCAPPPQHTALAKTCVSTSSSDVEVSIGAKRSSSDQLGSVHVVLVW